MPAVPDWSQPMTLTSPYGSLLLNQEAPGLGAYLLDGDGCKFNIVVRSTKDNVPQADGSILHHRFLTGAEMPLKIQLWDGMGAGRKPACDAQLALMLDTLTKHLRGLLNAGDNEGRLSWAVPGGQTRMLDDIRLLVYPDYTQDPAAMGSTVFATVDSQYPYAEDLTQTETHVSDGGSQVLDNTGTAEFFPVYKVNGSTSAFVLTNTTTGESLTYDGTAIGGGDYAELDSFRNTIFLNGDGADLLNGVDIAASLFPKLIPGANTLEITGADMDVLWQPAWG